MFFGVKNAMQNTKVYIVANKYYDSLGSIYYYGFKYRNKKLAKKKAKQNFDHIVYEINIKEVKK